MEFITHSAAQTEQLGFAFGQRLQPGDVINGGSPGGHAMLYIGNGLLIHCTGSGSSSCRSRTCTCTCTCTCACACACTSSCRSCACACTSSCRSGCHVRR